MRRALALLAVTLAAVAGLVAVQHAITPPPPAAEAAAPGAFALRWPAGTVWRYRLALSGHKTVHAGPTRLAGALDLAGHVELESHGRRGPVYLLAMRFAEVERHRLEVMGEALIPDAEAAAALFAGREALLEVRPDGAITGLRFAADTPPLFEHLARLVAGEIQVIVAPGEVTWEAQEDTQHGRALTDYEVVGRDAAGIDVGRYRFDYARLDGAPADVPVEVAARYRARIARAGHVERLEGSERIAAGEAVAIEGALEWVLVGIGRAAPGGDALAGFEARRTLDEWPVSEAALRMMRVRRAGDLTIDRMVSDLRAFGPGGEMPEHARWAWQATGRLLLEPGAAWHLGRLVLDDSSIGHRGRALALDLLASVGHAEAQAALRDALGGLPRDDRWPALLTRAGFVERPEPATVELVAGLYGAADGAARQSAATTLGAAAGHLYRAGDRDGALRHVRRLEGDLRAADGDERRALVLALGNAGVPEAVATVAGFVGDADPAVRRAAAVALRKTPGPVAEAALRGLMGDADPRVSRAAVRALGRHPLGAGQLAALADDLRAGRLGPETHGPLVDLLVRHRAVEPEARRALAAAIAARSSDGRVRARLARL